MEAALVASEESTRISVMTRFLRSLPWLVPNPILCRLEGVIRIGFYVRSEIV